MRGTKSCSPVTVERAYQPGATLYWEFFQELLKVASMYSFRWWRHTDTPILE
jgi:hypothetical protein